MLTELIPKLVPMFRHDSNTAYQTFGKDLFQYSALRRPETCRRLYDMINTMKIQIEAAEPTRFHRLMGKFAEAGRLLRLYTQNVDGFDIDMPSLAKIEGGANRWPIAIPLHGRLDTLFCERCLRTYPFNRSLFENKTVTAQCNNCLTSPVRTRSGRTSGPPRPSLLRPRMLFYNDLLDLDGDLIDAAFEFDMQQTVDTVLVVGTSLAPDVKGARNMVRRLCNPDSGRRKHTIWINPQPPPRDLEKFFNIVILARSDYVAEIWGASSGAVVVHKTCQPDADPGPSTAAVHSHLALDAQAISATAPTIRPTGFPTGRRPNREKQQCPICGKEKASAGMARHKRTCVTGSCNGNNFCSISQWNYHLTVCELGHPGQRAGPSTSLDVCKVCEEAFNFTNFKVHVRQKHQGQTPDFARTWTMDVRNARSVREKRKHFTH